MTTWTRFKTDAFEAIHSAARGLHRVGAIDKATLCGVDKSSMTLRLLAVVDKHGLKVLA